MKLAEALVIRADLQKRIGQMRNRMVQNALVQVGEQTPEDPMALRADIDGLIAHLERIMTSINLSNAQIVDGGESVTALLARRDCLRIRVQALRDLLDAASDTAMRARHNEIIVKSAVPVTELRREQDKLSEELRLLDLRIQRINWAEDLR